MTTITLSREREQTTDTYQPEPLLTQQQEREYIARSQAGDQDATQHLVQSNIGWIIRIAKRWLRQGVEFEDLIQEGCIGLLRAVDHFDLSTSFRLTTYASWWIRQTMDYYIMNTTMTIRVPVYLHPIMQVVKQHDGDDNDAALADYNPEHVAIVRQAMRPVLSLHALLLPTTSNDLTLADFLADSAVSTEERAIQPVFRREVEAVLEQVLSEREIRVLSLRYGLHNQEEHTLEQVGALERVTRERVRQIVQGAFAKLRRSSLVNSLHVLEER